MAKNTPPAETPDESSRESNKVALTLVGPQKTAAMMIALGETTEPFWNQFDDDELRDVSLAMSSLGIVPARQIEALAEEFIDMMSGKGDNASFSGSYTQTQKLLSQFLEEDKVNYLMQEVRGPAGRTMWDKLGNVNEALLANYLKNEYPQTVALILTKIKSNHAARVLSLLPHDFAMECVQRMLQMEPVKREVLSRIEETLRTEFMSNVVSTNSKDGHEAIAEIFNAFDRETEGRFMTGLEQKRKDAAEKIRALMFVFEDLSKLDSGSVQTLLRSVDKTRLGLALKGTKEELTDLFMSNMSERAGKLLKEEMNMMGPVKLKDVGLAQQEIVQTAKDLAEAGDIMIADGGGDDELIY